MIGKLHKPKRRKLSVGTIASAATSHTQPKLNSSSLSDLNRTSSNVRFTGSEYGGDDDDNADVSMSSSDDDISVSEFERDEDIAPSRPSVPSNLNSSSVSSSLESSTSALINKSSLVSSTAAIRATETSLTSLVNTESITSSLVQHTRTRTASVHQVTFASSETVSSMPAPSSNAAANANATASSSSTSIATVEEQPTQVSSLSIVSEHWSVDPASETAQAQRALLERPGLYSEFQTSGSPSLKKLMSEFTKTKRYRSSGDIVTRKPRNSSLSTTRSKPKSSISNANGADRSNQGNQDATAATSSSMEREEEEEDDEVGIDEEGNVQIISKNTNQNNQSSEEMANMDISDAIVQTSRKSKVTSSSFINPLREKRSLDRWSADETKKFYYCLRVHGTNFDMIQTMITSKDRHQIKNKFKKEEREHPDLIALALNPKIRVTVPEPEEESVIF